jgi:GNAT superfamily N-acetyltransferase
MDLVARSRIVETAEVEYLADSFAAAPPNIAAQLGMSLRRVGGGVASIMTADPTGFFWSRVLGLGWSEPVTDDLVSELLNIYSHEGAGSILIQISPVANPPGWSEILQRHGFKNGRSWVKLIRDVSEPPPITTDLAIRPLNLSEATSYASVYWEGFGLSDPRFVTWMGAHVGRAGWTMFGAFDKGTLVGVATMHHQGDVVCLSGAATLPSHRNRGAQSALMAARLKDAASSGAKWASTETGTETETDPNPSLHNMRRMGFEELYVRENWSLRFNSP